MDILHSVGSFLLTMFLLFIWVGALVALFVVISDLFRDRTLEIWQKVIWFIVLLFAPFLGTLIYLITRGRSMAERSANDVRKAQTAREEYIREVAGTSPSEEIAKAKELLDAGTISSAEYEALKAKALA